MSSARSKTVFRRTALALAAAWIAASSGCAPAAPSRGKAAATVFPLYDLARRVAGDRLQVKLILEPGMDPHRYQPRPQDVVGLADAGLIFAVGLGLDPWAQSLAKSSGAGEARVFELGPLMDPILAPPGMVRPEPFIDPHFWTDPVRAQRAVDVIVEALSGLDPEGAPFYRERGSALRRSIQALHVEVSRQSQTWTRRRIVTLHGSLFYFAQRYGLSVVGVVEPVPGGAQQPEHLQALVGELRAIEPAALFSEPQLDDQPALALGREAGVQVHKVDTVGGTPEALSYENLVRGIARAMDEAQR